MPGETVRGARNFARLGAGMVSVLCLGVFVWGYSSIAYVADSASRSRSLQDPPSHSLSLRKRWSLLPGREYCTREISLDEFAQLIEADRRPDSTFVACGDSGCVTVESFHLSGYRAPAPWVMRPFEIPEPPTPESDSPTGASDPRSPPSAP